MKIPHWPGPGPKIIKVAGTIVDAQGAAYATGDVVGALFAITGLLRIDGGNGTLKSIVAIDGAHQNKALDVVLFDANPSASTFTDNAAVSIHADDQAKVIGKVSFADADFTTFTGPGIATKGDLDIAVQAAGVVYGVVVSRGSPTYTEHCLSLQFGIEQN